MLVNYNRADDSGERRQDYVSGTALTHIDTK